MAKRFVILFLILVPSISYLTYRLIFSGDICADRASKKFGKSNELVLATKQERGQAPGIKEGGKIYLSFREQLKCERELRWLLP